MFRTASKFLLVLSLTAGCSKFDALNATVPSHGSIRTRDIAYGDQPRQKLDVYLPKKTKPGATVVVFFYGGDWQSGSKSDYEFVAQALASRGYIAVMPDYRLYPQVTFPAFVQDGARAVRWAHDNAAKFGGDPQRVFLMGHSAGAHIAALLTLDPHYLADAGIDRSSIRATVGLSGPYDFVPPNYDRGAFAKAQDDPAPAPDFEPIHFANGTSPPMLLIHGLKDKTVNPDNSLELFEKINAAGGNASYISYRKLDHVRVVLSLAASFRWLGPVLADASTFIDSH